MSELRYTELKYNGEIYTEQWKIDEILVKNKFNWMVNAEIKNARLEIFQDTLVWNGGIWYNGSWYFGVWRDGEWRYGTWENGVFYNGIWKNGLFKSGIIFNGKFFKGKIEGGEIRGGQFIDVKIAPEVIEFTEEEIQSQEEQKQQQNTQQQNTQQNIQQDQALMANPNPDKVVFHTTPSTNTFNDQPKIQENNNYNMKKIKKFEDFANESVGELEDSFIDINLDQTELEVSDKKTGKLQQKDGNQIIETPSKTDSYNAKMRLGGETIASKKYPEKSIHFVKKFNDLK